MEPEQYEIMSYAEDVHWWYLGLRDALAVCLARFGPCISHGPVVLDVGCGTGGNLRFLQSLLNPSYLAGFDLSEGALEIACKKCPKADLYVGDLCSPALRRSEYDILLCLDVIYVAGIESAFGGLQKLVQALVPNGLMLLHVPAYRWLYSEHDRLVHTRERYRLGKIQSLVRNLGLTVELISYRMFSLFPIVVAKRLPSILFRYGGAADLAQPPEFINRMLFRILQAENRLMMRGIRFPWGSSILAVCRNSRS